MIQHHPPLRKLLNDDIEHIFASVGEQARSSHGTDEISDWRIVKRPLVVQAPLKILLGGQVEIAPLWWTKCPG
jgi:hypothetical protein